VSIEKMKMQDFSRLRRIVKRSVLPKIENVAGAATLGWRVDNTNWKVTIPIVATAKDYENVLGARRDVLFQVGPAATYSLPPAQPGEPSFTFSLAATYNRNYSTLSTASWHGYVVQPTLTIAFQPPVAVQPDPGK
jgi:hypothetical protein